MSADSDGDPIEKAIGMCTMVQSMIDFTAKNLYGLRTRCATTEEITQKEIRDTETKLIKLFSRQLVAKAKLAPDEIPEKLAEYPKTDQWLIVVGIHPDIVKEVMERGVTIDTLLDMSEVEVRNFLRRYHTDDDDYEDAANKLSVALQNLKQWTERQLQGDKGTDSEVDLHWTSYYHKSTSSSPFSGSSPKHGQRPSTSSLPPDTYLNTPGSPAPSPGPTLPTPPQSTPSSPAPRTSGDKYRYTPPPTPPLARAKATSSSKYPSTPPPKRKIQLAPDAAFPLTKSKSHESQLANRVTDVDATNKYLASTSPRTQKKKPHNLKIGGSYEALNRRRLSTDGSEVGSISSHAPSGHMSPAVSSPIRSPPFKQQDLPTVFDDFSKPNTLTVPRSPKTFYGPRMLHSINHRLITKIVFGACDICHKNMMRGKICKDCKFKCHRDCAGKAAAACCLPNEYVEVFIESLRDGSPNPSRRLLAPGSSPSSISDIGVLKPVMSVPVFTTVPPPPPDTSSSATSSCNSSTPSSPALVMMTSPASMATSPSPAPSPSPQIQVTQFTFPGEHMSLSSSSSAVSQSRMSPCSSASYVSLVSPYSNLPPHSSNLNLNLHPPTSSASVHDSLQSSNNGSALSDHTLHGDYIYQRPRSNSAQSLQLVIRDSIPSMHDPGAGSDSVSTSISVTGSNYPGPSPEVLVTDMSANSPLGSPVASPLKRRTTPRSQTVASIASVGAYCNPPIPISPDPGVRASSLAQLHESPPSSPGYHTKYYDPGHRLSWTNNENRCMSIDAGYRSRFSSIAYRKKSFDSIVSAWSSPRTRRKKSFESGQALSLESPKTGRRRFWDPLMADWTDPKHRRRAESNAKGSKMAMLARANPYLLQQSHGSVPTLAAYDSPQTRKKSFESLINALSSPKIKKKSHDSTGPLPTWGEPPKSEKKKIHGSIPLLLWDSPKIRKKTFDGWGSPKTPKRSMDSPKITKKFDKPKPVYKPIESQIQVWSYGNPMTRKKSYDSIFANWSSPKIRKKSYEKLHIAGWDSPVQLRKRSMDYTGMNWSAAPSSRRNSFDPSSLTVSPVCPLSPSYRKKSFDRSTLSQKIKSAFQSFIGTSTPDISSHSPPHHKNPSLAVHTNDSRLFLSAPPSPSFLPPGFTYSPETPRLILTSAGQAQPVYLGMYTVNLCIMSTWMPSGGKYWTLQPFEIERPD